MTTEKKHSPLQFFRTFQRGIILSFSDLNYYVDVLNAPLKFSFKFVLFFYLLLGMISTAYFAIVKLPQYNIIVDQTAGEIRQYYPEDWQFTWDGERLISNSSDQRIIHFPSAFPQNEQLPSELAIIDTQNENAPENVPALLYINAKTLYVNSLSGFWSDLPLTEIMENNTLVIDREKVLSELPSYVKDVTSSLSTLPLFVAIGMSFGLFIVRFISIAINSIIIRFFLTTMGKPLPYKKVLQLSLHILIPVEVLQQLSTLLYPQLDIPMFSLAFWILVILLLFYFRNLHMVKLVKEKK